MDLRGTVALVTGGNLDVVGFPVRAAGGWEMVDAVVTRFVEHHGDAKDLPVVTTVRKLHALTAEEASRAYPVRLHGVITYFDPKYGFLFLQDATGGTFVEAHKLVAQPIRAGQLAEVTGISDPGFFAPEVDHCAVRVISRAKLPTAAADASEDLYSGSLDSNWVRTRGVVQSVSHEADHTVLHLASGVHRFDAELVGDAPWADALINSSISLEGAAGAHFNTRKQLTGVIIRVPGREQIRVVWRSPDPESLPFTPVSQLFEYSPSSIPDRPFRVRGVVTSSMTGGPTYIQDSTGALVISNHRAIKLRPGDLVNALGFGRFTGFSPMLQDAV